MSRKIVLNTAAETNRNVIENAIDDFANNRDYLAKGSRNSIKKIRLKNGEICTIKAFKIPNFFNKIIYRFFRDSKAKRSFDYANLLIEKGFKTPTPIAYAENRTGLFFLDAYYFCAFLDNDFTYREVVHTPNFPDFENVLRQFTQFTFALHQAGIEFLDHSPGNTLIVDHKNGTYDFYLVDLNRMKFHDSMTLEQRINNFVRLTPHRESVEIMAKEYARLMQLPEEEIVEKMWAGTEKFQEKFHKKQARKKRLKKLFGKQ
ncbi:Kdo domain containing protein [Vaginella massiliensis]|uniref:Kdo domain containing protein n=1 Tax=Vaginella massiliensis TaxID=1816680 RepID=UPI0008394A34|nr:Kdo domain containing protein [Vaginella massiliensis]